jgi:uncharacterized protein (TIGR02145 family)
MNSVGTAYGELVSFTAAEEIGCDGTFTDDRDGQQYCYKTIGTQIWMIENLAYLPVVNPGSADTNTTPCYYVYGYNGSNVSDAKATANFGTYGVLYNWPAAMTACPSGWHLPTNAEWTTLTTYLGGESIAGGKMKEIVTAHWSSPNTGATNESGFSALPGGNSTSGGFPTLGGLAYFWSASEVDASLAWGLYLHYNLNGVLRYYDDRSRGFSVRCLQN